MKNMTEPRHAIISSSGQSLHFPSEELYQQYQKEHRALTMKFYGIIRAQCGVWASNQNKFVASRADFNSSDSTIMEDLFDEHSGDGE